MTPEAAQAQIATMTLEERRQFCALFEDELRAKLARIPPEQHWRYLAAAAKLKALIRAISEGPPA